MTKALGARLPAYATSCLAALFLAGCSAPAAEKQAPAAAPAEKPAASSVTLPTGYPDRPFVRVQFDTLTWRPTEGNTLGVETAVVEGDPSKPGYYVTINHFPKSGPPSITVALVGP